MADNRDMPMEQNSNSRFDRAAIAKYESLLPSELISLWKDGIGTQLDGYLKLINPDDYIQIVKDTYLFGDRAIPFMATAFGDLIVWRDNRYVCLLDYRHCESHNMIANMGLFFRLLGDATFLKRFFSLDLYHEAVKANGSLPADECFGFFPLLALGGAEKVARIRKVKMREHIALMAEAVGVI